MKQLLKPTQISEMEIQNDDDRIFKSWGSVEVRDREGDLIPMNEFRKVMNTIMSRGGIVTDQHSNRVVAKILNYEFKDKQTPEGLREGMILTCQVFKDYDLDDMVWEGVKKGIYQGLSFGGRNKDASIQYEKGGDLTTVLKQLEGFEFALVPSMANQEATMIGVNYLAKSGKDISINERLNLIEKEIGLNKNKLDNNMDKARVSLRPGQEPPKGVNVQTGPRGGRYFESTPGQAEEKPSEEKPETKFSEEQINEFRRDEIFPKSEVEYKGKTFFVSPEFETDPDEVGDTKIPIASTMGGSRVAVVDINELFPPKDFEVEKELVRKYYKAIRKMKSYESFIKNNALNKDMVKDMKKEGEEIAPQEDPENNSQDQVIQLLQAILERLPPPTEKEDEDPEEKKPEEELEKQDEDKPKEEKEEKKPEEEKEVEKDGEKVVLPKTPEEKTESQKPAEGAEQDKVKIVEKMKAEIKKDILKSLKINENATTPKPGMDNLINKKGLEGTSPTNFKEGNKAIKAYNLR